MKMDDEGMTYEYKGDQTLYQNDKITAIEAKGGTAHDRITIRYRLSHGEYVIASHSLTASSGLRP